MTIRESRFYRYLLAFRPDADMACWLTSLADEAGQARRRVRTEHFHLTLCVVAETKARDRFIASRIEAALTGRLPPSCPFWLGRVKGGGTGATIRAKGRQVEVQAFYQALVACLAKRDISPLYREGGLGPHVTLGYDPCAFDPFKRSRRWIPDELFLIESEVGLGVHNLLARWPLLPPRQSELPFDPPRAPLRIRASGSA